MIDHAIYRFGDIHVDFARMSLWRGQQPVLVEPKAFDVLRFLIEHRDRLVTKDELLDAIWRDTFVTPNALTRVVAQLRKAIGDDAQKARYIQTVTKRGYRFVAAIVPEAAPEPERADAAAPQPRHLSAAPRSRVWTPATFGAGVAALAFVALFAWGSRSGATAEAPGTPPPPLVAHRVTTRNANDMAPAISDDGHAIAYVSDRSGRLEIYVVATAPGSQEVAITSDGGQNIDPAWSPDGRLIAYHSMKRGGIWVIPSTGGASQQVTDTGTSPAWSPDGRVIAYASGEGASPGQSTINLVNADGTGLRELTARGSPLGGHFNPTWSRSGRVIAFTVSNGAVVNGIWMVEAAGGAPRRLTSMAWVGPPHFSPDDRSLYFGNMADGGSPRLYQLPIDESKMSAIGPPVEVMPFEGGKVEGLSLARDHTLAFGLQVQDANLWAVDVLPNGSVSEPRRVTDEVVRAGRPEYSADGRVAFVSWGTGRPTSSWVMNEDGATHQPLMPEALTTNPTWGPGNRVLLSRNPGKSDFSFVWVDVATRRATEVTGIATEGIRFPRVSPDGREVAFWTLEPSGAMNVWVQALDGDTARRRVTSSTESINFPSWSPDGKWLAVEVKRGETTSVGVVSKDGGAVELLTNAPGQSWPHSWSPDGERIAYAGLRDGVWNLFEVSRRTKVSRQLTRFTSASGYVRYPAWSPKGNRIIFERGIQSSGIWRVKLRQ
jgi:Tol biopolymer transport system component/DNA-binding winged helix-turn-helix (wHTH) protein